MVGFPDATTRPLEAEKFTVVVTTYKRPKSVRELLMGLEGLDKMDRVWSSLRSRQLEACVHCV